MSRTIRAESCAWCGAGAATGPDRVGSLGHDVCDYCLIGLIVLVCEPVLDPRDPESLVALGRVMDSCG